MFRKRAFTKAWQTGIDVRHASAAGVDGAFDVVLANLVGATLMQIASDLRARVARSGRLVAAGITREREPEVVAAVAAHGLRVVERDERDDWVRLILTP